MKRINQLDIVSRSENVQSYEDFVRLLDHLVSNYHQQLDSWENDTLSTFLESFWGYVDDAPPDDRNVWKYMAVALVTARIYE